MYNGPLKVHVTGPGGATHPRYPSLVAKGRAMLGTMAARAGLTGPTAMSSYWFDNQGNTVKALHTTYVNKLELTVVSPAVEGERSLREQADTIEAEVWSEVHRDTYIKTPIGANGLSVITSNTFETPYGEAIRFLMEPRNDAGAPAPGGPTPDNEWTESGRNTEVRTVNGVDIDVTNRVSYDVPAGSDVLSVVFDYATEADKPDLPSGTAFWREAHRETELLSITTDNTEVERILSVTFMRLIFEAERKVLRFLKFLYEEGQEGYTWPSTVQVLDPQEG